jgi:hypothetical protein
MLLEAMPAMRMSKRIVAMVFVVALLAGDCPKDSSVERSYLRATFTRSLFLEQGESPDLDQDEDGLVDDSEGRLAFAFRPYVVFDSDEEARAPGEPVTLFQVRRSSIGGVTSGGTRIHRVLIKWVFLFRQDGGYGPDSDCSDDHEGDNDDALFDLESRDGGLTWRLERAVLSSRGPDDFAGPDWPTDSSLEVFDQTHPKIYLSAHKHHEYFTTDWDHDDSLYSASDCNDDVNGMGSRFLVNIGSIARYNNVGEEDAHGLPFVDDLSEDFPGHTAWGDEDFYEVGPIKEKWIT